MNIPFTVGRGNLDRFGVTRAHDIMGGPRNVPAPRVDDDHDDDDRTPLSPRLPNDLEAQRTGTQEEMAERSRPASRFMYRFRPSFLSVASTRRLGRQRPASSNYSGDGMPPDTVVNGDESPKTPQFRLAVQDLPSTRLYLPNLTRTWTQGSNGPPSRPPTASVAGSRSPVSSEAGADQIIEPSPAVLAQDVGRTGSRSRRRGNGSEREGAEAARDGHGRRRRHRREGSDRSHRANRSNRSGSQSQPRGSGSRGEASERPTPKRFLFCFPWIKSRRIRSQILRCFVSGLFLTLILAVYLSLSITKNINNSEFTVLLILIILFVTIFFCHGLIRLCMLVVRGGRGNDDGDRARLPEMMGPGGYAIPRRPIRVVLARDEEAAGIEGEATKTNPPPYGRWRESVRVDPDRIYWQRNDAAPETVAEDASSDSSPEREANGGQGESSTARTTAPRPPSYSSDDGVSYVVEAQPRSIAPTMDVPLRSSMPMHPSEAGRAGQPPSW
ncbi:hypothetical protein QBC34DRAFT_293181 [Podospora aff. communis PSN243]|uniref:Uncharacterized protein n=1 Tax=Podospora aff. communis PSN243 TaxID=3040156 RepID=A0AAV9GX93_9PEZI|nr:hypothetical protein QBC34DRAFT_293181 [Podospora aff. communis PSN243]